MPWDGTELCVGTVRSRRRRANHRRYPRDRGRPRDGDLPARVLAGWPARWPISRTNRAGTISISTISRRARSRALTDDQVEVGQPAWAQGMRAYAFADDGQGILFLRNEGGFRRLCRHDAATDEIEPVRDLAEYTWLAQPIVAPRSGRLAAVGTSPTIPDRVVDRPPRQGRDAHPRPQRGRGRAAGRPLNAAPGLAGP